MIRITGGELKGHPLVTPPDQQTRPTVAKLRQALMNSIQFEVADAKVLDLFAGSGALGFETLSRGALLAVFVESGKHAIQAIEKNIKTLKVQDRSKLIAGPIEKTWEQAAALGPYQIVFADPPYSEGWEMKLLETMPWERLLEVGGLFCLEWGKHKSKVDTLPEKISGLEKIREKTYGDSYLTHYRRT